MSQQSALAVKGAHGLEHPLQEGGRLRNPGLFSLDRRRLRGVLTKMCKYMCKDDGARLFPVAGQDAMGTN